MAQVAWNLVPGPAFATLTSFSKCAGYVPSFSTWSSDSKILLSAGEEQDGSMFVCDAFSGTRICRLEEKIKNHRVRAFAHDGKMLAAASPDGAVVSLVDAISGKAIRPLEASQRDDNCTDVVFSPDGSILAGRCNDSHVRLWNVATGKVLRQLRRS